MVFLNIEAELIKDYSFLLMDDLKIEITYKMTQNFLFWLPTTFFQKHIRKLLKE